MDFNNNQFLDQNEMAISMIMYKYDLKSVEEAGQRAAKFAKDPKMGLTWEEYAAFMKSYEQEEKKGGKRDGPRMEIHMEEFKDGSSKMTIIMEGAQKLAATASALA